MSAVDSEPPPSHLPRTWDEHSPAAHLLALGIGGAPHPIEARIEALSHLRDQARYEAAAEEIFRELDGLDGILAKQ